MNNHYLSRLSHHHKILIKSLMKKSFEFKLEYMSVITRNLSSIGVWLRLFVFIIGGGIFLFISLSVKKKKPKPNDGRSCDVSQYVHMSRVIAVLAQVFISGS